ncbi:MAG: hypothetical protein AMXMBFR47_29470 [Planctomycetota bacterium]
MHSDALLRAILTVVARGVFPPSKLSEIVFPKGAGAKQVHAYNLCDGSKSQADITKILKLDPGNFSRTVARWIDSGIVFRLGEGREAKLLHVYPLPADAAKKKGGDK